MLLRWFGRHGGCSLSTIHLKQSELLTPISSYPSPRRLSNPTLLMNSYSSTSQRAGRRKGNRRQGGPARGWSNVAEGETVSVLGAAIRVYRRLAWHLALMMLTQVRPTCWCSWSSPGVLRVNDSGSGSGSCLDSDFDSSASRRDQHPSHPHPKAPQTLPSCHSRPPAHPPPVDPRDHQED